MKPNFRIALRIAAALAAVIAPLAAQGQTPFTTGSAEVRGFHAVSSTVVHAVAYGSGVYRSTNAGVAWTRIGLPGNARYVTGIAGNTNQIVVAGEEGVFRSTDGGLTYGFQLAEPAAVVAMPPGASNVVLVGVKGLGIMRSTNGGTSFAAANNSAFDSLDPAAIAFHPNATTVYAAMRPDGVGNRGGVFRSLDGGATWVAHTAMPGVANNKFVTDLVVDTNGAVYATVFRLTDGGGDIFRQDGGAGAWNASGFFGSLSLHRDTSNGLTIWAGSRGLGLQRRVNGAGVFDYTFANDGTPNIFYTAINAVTTLPGTTIALKAIKGAGVWRTTSYTPFNWSRVTGLSGAERVLSASNVGANASSMLMGLQAGGVWRTTDGGANWAPPVVNGAQADFAYANGANAVNAFISIWDIGASTTTQVAYVAAGGKGMFYTNDNPGVFRYNGTRWQGIGNNVAAPSGPYSNVNEPGGLTLPSAQVWGAAMHRTDDSRAYVGTFGQGGVYYRSGGTWTTPANPAAIAAMRSIVSSASNVEVLLGLSFDDKPSRSTNGGANWTLATMSQFGFERVRFFSVAELSATVWIGGSNKGLMRSTDGGVSWTRVAMAGVFQKQAITGVGLKASNGRAFAADFAGNRYCSSNAGASWVSAGAPLRAGVNAIKTWGGNLYYLTDGAGMFREDGTC